MIRTIFAIASALSISSAACSVALVDSAGEPSVDSAAVVIVSQDSGGSGCAPNQVTCYAWLGSTQAQGMCTTAGVCCTGCIDSRGTCRDGDSVTSCGGGGSACRTCVDANECTSDSCNSYGVCQHGANAGAPCGRGVGLCEALVSECCTGAFVSVYDVPSMSNVLQCATSCPACTCKNASTHVCEASLDVVNCTCP